ncbi:MAG TPA: hypothetical protein PKZ26_05950 [Anaerolineaceae bacterium]|nr:hypothetical protein [Anaerolineaceae bacterium]
MELADLLEGIYFIGQIPEWRIISLTIPSLGGDDEKVAGARKPASQARLIKFSCALGTLFVKVNGQPLGLVFIINPSQSGQRAVIYLHLAEAGKEGYKVTFGKAPARVTGPQGTLCKTVNSRKTIELTPGMS